MTLAPPGDPLGRLSNVATNLLLLALLLLLLFGAHRLRSATALTTAAESQRLALQELQQQRLYGSAGPVSAEALVEEALVGTALPLPPGGSRLPRVHPRPLPSRLSDFSSFSCSAGSQRLSDPRVTLPQAQMHSTEGLTEPRHRLCVLRDVCMVGGAVTYFADAALASAAPPAAGATIADADVFLGQFQFTAAQGLWRPAVLAGPRPSHLPFAPEDRTYVLDDLSFAENFGHLLMDNFLPAYAAAEVLGLDPGDLQLLGQRDCAHSLDKGLVVGGERSEDMCARNVAAWSAALFAFPYLTPPYAQDFCVRELVVGHAPGFALASSYAHRAATARTARAHAHARLGVPPSAPLQAHTVLVMLKHAEHALVAIPELCSLVEAWVAALQPPPELLCVMPAGLGLEEQLRLQANVTVYVAEAGSTAYGAALFGRPGASLVSVVPGTRPGNIRLPLAKEAQVFLATTDVQAWYYSLQSLVEEGWGAGAMLLALERAGQRLNLPPVALDE